MSNSKYSKLKLETQIEQSLKEEGIDYRKEVYANGIAVDFLINTPTSGSVILEVKDWKANLTNLDNAQKISNALKTSANVNQAFVVITSPPEILSKFPGVITPSQIFDVIKNKSITPELIKKPQVREFIPRKRTFVAMPFDNSYEDVYYAIERSCSSVEIKSDRVDFSYKPGDIKKRILNDIATCDFLIADISESKPNVMFEIGYAEGLKKSVIQVCSTPPGEIPLDIRNDSTIFYEKGRTHLLEEKLVNILRTNY